MLNCDIQNVINTVGGIWLEVHFIKVNSALTLTLRMKVAVI